LEALPTAAELKVGFVQRHEKTAHGNDTPKIKIKKKMLLFVTQGCFVLQYRFCKLKSRHFLTETVCVCVNKWYDFAESPDMFIRTLLCDASVTRRYSLVIVTAAPKIATRCLQYIASLKWTLRESIETNFPAAFSVGPLFVVLVLQVL
jgi:hypothetical protein